MKTGAHGLLDALTDAGIDTCFGNPGTSEMHLVAALSDQTAIKQVLCLFEGGVTGAADGYARMTGKPAATLLHLGPGLANGLANVHNAKKAGSPMLNVIGDHTTFHKQYDAPLNSNIEGTAAPYSHWVRTVPSPDDLAADTADAISASMSHGGQIASLIIPADIAWEDFAGGETAVLPERTGVRDERLETAKALLESGRKTGIILGKEALYGPGLIAAGQIAQATGAALFSPYASGRIERGGDLPQTKRIPFPVDAAVQMMAPYEQILLFGAAEPVAFFAYPGLPSRVMPEGCDLVNIATPREDILPAILDLAKQVEGNTIPKNNAPLPATGAGPLTAETLMDTIANEICEDLIVVDEGVTSTHALFARSDGCPKHDYLVNVGGSIGAGLPLALGAAVACPDRPVLCMSGDGSAAYTFQVLWSMAQHDLNVTTVICANHSYQILKGEMIRVGAMTPDSPPNPLLELGEPRMDWVALATGMGVPAIRCETAEELAAALHERFRTPGPTLIEAALA